MDPAIELSLLQSIAGGRLMTLCGAGLSMAPPSSAPSAVAVARACREAYRSRMGSELAASLGDDIEAIARHFFGQPSFKSLFIDQLVPWPLFDGRPNPGHEALADFLACKVLEAVVSTNVDGLLEAAARDLGEPDFRAVVDAADLATPTVHGSLLKVHGCGQRLRDETIWCADQLAIPPVRNRLQRFATWLASHLLGKDLLVVGFWTDWAYLSELFADNLTGVGPQTVYVVNPDDAVELQRKAPKLWAWANGPGITFHHIKCSGDELLDDLRRTWSARFLWRLMDAASPTYVTLFGPPPGAPPDLHGANDANCLYALRRDVTGVPATRPVRDAMPSPADHVAAAVHRRLIDRGASVSPHRYEFSGQKLRVVSARGQLLSSLRAQFQSEPTPLGEVDQVICVGAVPDPTPPDIIRGTHLGSIVRPGSRARWTTHDQLLPLLQDPT